jgi:FixJ family two-component response regulator
LPHSDDSPPTVVVIDDDEQVRASLQGLFRSVGLAVKSFASVQAYLSSDHLDDPGCLVLDIRLPGFSGLEFQGQLNSSNNRRPIIFISGYADVAMSVRAMKAGAVEFLTKPVKHQELLDAVQLAIQQDKAHRLAERELATVRALFETLSEREREFARYIVTGRRNKEIARELGVTEATVKLHRGNIMRKMRANSLVELVRAVDLVGPKTSAT